MSTRGVAALAQLLSAVLCLLLGPARQVCRQAAERQPAEPSLRERHGDLAIDLAVVLAARYLAQAAAIAMGRGVTWQTRVSIESLHALSMVGAAVAVPSRRRTALTGMALAAGVMAIDVTQRIRRRHDKCSGAAR